MNYLPSNRGANLNVWFIIENTELGYSIHNIDAGLIIVQKKIPQYIQDTARLYVKEY